MRKIVFRGKDKRTDEWINWDFYYNDKFRKKYIEPNTIGQFTGVFDDTDERKPIWEGDILEIEKINDDATSQKVIAVVKWLDIFGGFVVERLNKKGSIALFSQVISDFIVYKKGNIYDNPELLKGD